MGLPLSQNACASAPPPGHVASIILREPRASHSFARFHNARDVQHGGGTRSVVVRAGKHEPALRADVVQARADHHRLVAHRGISARQHTHEVVRGLPRARLGLHRGANGLAIAWPQELSVRVSFTTSSHPR
jgi:hypothetical protein